MLPENLIPHSIRQGQILPHYLTAADHPWLRELLEVYDGFVGRARRELETRLQEPLACHAPEARRRVAIRTLDRLYPDRPRAAVSPMRAREALFCQASRSEGPRSSILEEVAASLGIQVAELEEALFGDLPGERKLQQLPSPLGADELALRVNLLLAQAILFRSRSIEIEAEGNARAIVRHAKLQGLMITLLPRSTEKDAILEVSGPYTLFRRTLVYGRAMASLVPFLKWCTRFEVRSRSVLRQRERDFVIGPGDPIFPAATPRRHDSKLEERFMRDFRRLAPSFDIVREPEPVKVGDRFIYPDFAIERRNDPSSRWLVEIVGFWTPDYLEKKLRDLREADIPRLILCLDEDRNCGDADLPDSAEVLRFRRRIDPATVLRAMGVQA